MNQTSPLQLPERCDAPVILSSSRLHVWTWFIYFCLTHKLSAPPSEILVYSCWMWRCHPNILRSQTWLLRFRTEGKIEACRWKCIKKQKFVLWCSDNKSCSTDCYLFMLVVNFVFVSEKSVQTDETKSGCWAEVFWNSVLSWEPWIMFRKKRMAGINLKKWAN